MCVGDRIRFRSPLSLMLIANANALKSLKNAIKTLPNALKRYQNAQKRYQRHKMDDDRRRFITELRAPSPSLVLVVSSLSSQR